MMMNVWPSTVTELIGPAVTRGHVSSIVVESGEYAP